VGSGEEGAGDPLTRARSLLGEGVQPGIKRPILAGQGHLPSCQRLRGSVVYGGLSIFVHQTLNLKFGWQGTGTDLS